jgi:hypothetical protein
MPAFLFRYEAFVVFAVVVYVLELQAAGLSAKQNST